jgi:hypothetical protein
MPAEVLSIDQLRAARQSEKATRVLGNCARGAREERGMRNQAECSVHGPYLPPDNGSSS